MAKYSQVEKDGLYELTADARTELMSSGYYNDDLSPTTVAERTWTTYNISMLWVGMSICIPSLSLASGCIAFGISPWLSVLNVALGNILILIPIQLNSQIGTKYGVPYPLFARLTFGAVGAHLPSVLRAITACGWVSVQAWVGGGAVGAMIGAFVPSFSSSDWIMNLPSWGGMQPAIVSQFIGYIIFIGVSGLVAFFGLDKIKAVQDIGGPVLIVVMIGLLIWSFSLVKGQYSFFEIMAQPNDDALIAESGGFAFAYLTCLMGNIAFWATLALNIPDFSRYVKSQKDQVMGQLIGMPVPMAFCAFVGAYYAQATKIAFGTAMFDPTEVLYALDNRIVVFIAAVGTIAATITTTVAANIVAPANGFSNIKPDKINFRGGVVITIFIAFFILQAWWIYGSGGAYFTWMNAYGTILAPIAAIFIADYYVVKKGHIEVAALFQGKEGRYWYISGVNWAAIISWFVSFILPLLVYFGVSGGFINFVNEINYVWSFAVAFIVYVLLMKTSMAGNSFITKEEHDAFTQKA